jgi:hypothetical protein
LERLDNLLLSQILIMTSLTDIFPVLKKKNVEFATFIINRTVMKNEIFLVVSELIMLYGVLKIKSG